MIDVGADLQRAYDDGYAHGIADAMKWIPCSEAVPATEDKVLCQTITKKGVVNFVIGYHTENFGWACGMNSNVLAWMPLPEPYEERRT